MILRDGESGVETLLLRRTATLVFAAGMYVFPGGAVDSGDRGSTALNLVRGRTDVEASLHLGVDSGGLGYWNAAARECFEESGLLLAHHSDGSPIDFSDAATAERFANYRVQLAERGLDFWELLARENLYLDVSGVHYWSHWITPIGSPRRYDTRFFVCAAPAGQDPSHDDGELVTCEWVRPVEALEKFREGSLPLILPTVKCLEALTTHANVQSVLHAAGRTFGN